MQELVLIRGVPGSGKSTYAKNHYANYTHLESDMYHVGPDGVYRWNPRNIKDAHAWCQHSTEKALRAGESVVVSNTFTQLWEMDEYFKIAERCNVPVVVIRLYTQYGNIHNVPESTVQKMLERFEDFTDEEKVGL